MELRHVRYFIAVAEHLHFARAAEALATAQPSLSRQILQLEDELGVKLFERTKRRVALTRAGEIFLDDARRVMQAVDASVRHVRESADGTRGQLRIAFVSGAMMMKLPAVLREYRRRYPNVEVVPHAMAYPEHVAALRDGTIDIAWSIAIPAPDIASQLVRRDAFLVALPDDHRLLAHDEINPKELRGESLVVIARSVSPVLYDDAMERCLAGGFRPVMIHEAFEEESVLGLVAGGFGNAIVPVAWSRIGVPGVAFRPTITQGTLDESLIWHRDRMTPIVRAFIDTALALTAPTTS
jgi:DNA-binding transcriptional LysR family regulator